MIEAKHFLWKVEGKVGVITLNRPERRTHDLRVDAELRVCSWVFKNIEIKQRHQLCRRNFCSAATPEISVR